MGKHTFGGEQQVEHKYKFIGYCLIAAFLVSLSTAEASTPKKQPKAIKGDLKLLKMVVETHKKNLQKIKMWQGRAVIKNKYEDKTGYLHASEVESVFILDLKNKRFRWFNTINKDVRKGLKNYIPKKTPYIIAAMLDKYSYYELIPRSREPNSKTKSCPVVWPRGSYKLRKSLESFNPVIYLTDVPMESYGYLMNRYDSSEEERDKLLHIERAGDIVTVSKQYTSPDSIQVKCFLCFDLAKGGSVIEDKFETSYGHKAIKKWTYKKIDSIWIPSAYSEYHKDLSRTITRDIKFFDNTMNKKVDPKEFTTIKLGMKPAIPIADKTVDSTCRCTQCRAKHCRRAK